MDRSINLLIEGFNDPFDLSLKQRELVLQSQPVFHRGFAWQAWQTTAAAPTQQGSVELCCLMITSQYACDPTPA
jgi:hypothetical protein